MTGGLLNRPGDVPRSTSPHLSAAYRPVNSAALSELNCHLINARSLSNKLPDLHDLLYNSSPHIDILFVTESWLTSSISDGVLDPQNRYNIFRHDRPDDFRGGGVCLFTNKSLKVSQLNTEHINSIIDIIGIDIFKSSKLSHRFFLAYRPPSTSSVYNMLTSDIYFQQIIDFVTANVNSKGSTVMLGDLNCPNIDWPFNKPLCNGAEVQLVDFVNINGMTQYVNTPTHNSHILDVVLVNDQFTISSLSVIEPFSTSDHCAILFTVSFESNYDEATQCIVYDWQKADWLSFNNFLFGIDWSRVASTNLTVDLLWSAFCEILNRGIEMYIPHFIRNTNLSKSNRKYPKSVRKLQSKKSKVWRAMKMKPDDDKLVSKYKQLATQCNDAIRAHEIEQETKIIQSDNIGTFYKFVNNRLSHPSGIGVLYSSNGDAIIEDSDKAELLNVYFESVYVDDNGVLPECESRVSAGVKIDNVTFNPDTIHFIVKNLKSKTTRDPDGYPPILVKRLISSLTYPLSLIFSSFMSVSKVPQSWKDAIITPIFKKGLSSDVKNYRPISLTSVFGKLMERVIVNQLLTYLTHNGLINKNQHGFLRRLSTCTNLVECVNDWTVLLEDGSQVAIAYIDFKRAFDSVTHIKLIYKLKSYGITGTLLEFIEFYLHSRTHCTRVGSKLSNSAKIRSGVIQGSCLGPILFVLFVNDIVDKLHCCTTAKLYADDVKLYAAINIDQGYNNLQASLDIIYRWSLEWQLLISFQKCFILLINTNLKRDFLDKFVFKIDTYILEYKPVARDLGVLVDNRLAFSNHIAEITKKANQRANLIFRCFNSNHSDSMVKAFTTYVRPLLEYNSQIWSPNTVNAIFKIEQVQRHFTKRLPGFSNLTYMQRLRTLGLDSLELRRLRLDLTLLYKIIFNKTGLESKNFIFIQSHESRKLRSHRYQIRPIHKYKVAGSDRCLFSRTTSIWNGLPADTNFTSLKTFIDSLSLNYLIRHCKLNFS